MPMDQKGSAAVKRVGGDEMLWQLAALDSASPRATMPLMSK
ncbi:MAG: hypothetical protein P8M73_08465 [Luminiphilus sp.]|nr:hypothetical protein [Luminiphilus sp.]